MQLGEDLVGGLGPGKGLQCSFQLRQNQPMAAVKSVTLVKSPRRSAWRSTMEKNTFLVSSTGASGASSESTSPLTGLAASAAVGLMGLLAYTCHRRPPFVLIFSLQSMVKQV